MALEAFLIWFTEFEDIMLIAKRSRKFLYFIYFFSLYLESFQEKARITVKRPRQIVCSNANASCQNN